MKVGLLSGMFLIFLTLKLSGVIAWSWWWVTAPLWGVFALLLIGFLVLLGLSLLTIDTKQFKKKEK